MRLAFVGLGSLVLWIGCIATGVVEERPGLMPPDGGPSLGPPQEGGGPCASHCSNDLRSVDDCHGQTIQACQPNEGCSDSTCVPACQAADEARGTLGCEFFVAPVAFQKFFSSDPSGTCTAAMIANGGKLPVSVSATYRGASLDIARVGRLPRTRGGAIEYEAMPADGMIPPEGIAIFFLQQSTEGLCPVPASVTGPMLAGTGFGESFRLRTSLPVNAYSVMPALTTTTTLALLYPSPSWGTSYVAAVSEPSDADRPYMSLQDEETAMTIVAKEATTVIVTPSRDLVGNDDAGVRSTGAGSPRHFTIPAGGTLQLSQRQNLSGTIVTADKPVGLLTGATWYQFASRHHQMAPVHSTGHRYAAIRPRDHDIPNPEKHGWRFVGITSGTKLTYHPAPPVDAPTELERGQVVEIEAGERFVVESQDAAHPFALVEGTRSALGSQFGPRIFESVPAIGLDQLVSSQLLYTVPGFEIGHLVVVREADADGAFHAVELDCLGAITGFTSIDAAGHYQYALIDTPKFDYDKNTTYCDLGRHSMRSDAPFGVTVWGWSGHHNYAYPAATGLRIVNDVDVSVQ